jgi:hypothetical protein
MLSKKLFKKIFLEKYNCMAAFFLFHSRKFSFVYNLKLKRLFTQITKTSLPTLIVSAVSIFLLALVREQINDRFKSKMIMPVPIELIIVRLFNSVYKCYLNEFIIPKGNFWNFIFIFVSIQRKLENTYCWFS